MEKDISRRKFIQTGALGLAGLTIVPSTILGKSAGYKAPSDKLNIAGIGVGGKGFVNLQNMSSENIVALCDVDWEYAKKAFDKFPQAKKFWDYREMYDQIGKEFDAVVIATPDHTHALTAADAITMGKHVYLQKPLTHSVYESRLLTKLAQKYKVATQMGNEGASEAGFRQAEDVVASGILGDVYQVDAFTNRPLWPQGLERPTRVDAVPSTLRWDLFLGPAEIRTFSKAYHPWNWRGWWDFGTGALGDMACHIFHPIYNALKLGTPTSVQATSTRLFPESAPSSEMVTFRFPQRGKIGKVNYPEVMLNWYDGGLKPPRPKGLPADFKWGDGGTVYYGTKDTLIFANRVSLLSGKEIKVPSVSRVIPTSHEMDWVRACKESADSRLKPVSDFDVAGPLNEMVVAGVAAVRLQKIDKELLWDAVNMKFSNISENEPEYAFAQELMKHTYRNGYKLPDMP